MRQGLRPLYQIYGGLKMLTMVKTIGKYTVELWQNDYGDWVVELKGPGVDPAEAVKSFSRKADAEREIDDCESYLGRF